jgi:hypothetical protein
MEGVAAFGKVAVIGPTVPSGRSDAMNEFIQRHRAEVIGALSGFDRLRIRGILRLLSYVEVMSMYLGLVKVLLKDLILQR